LARDKNDKSVRFELMWTYVLLARLDRGDRGRAANSLNKARKNLGEYLEVARPYGPIDHYRLASLEALSAELVPGTDGKRASVHMKQACEYLRTAWARGFRNVDYLRGDHGFVVLHKYPAFQKLLDEMK
jgi:hypothetical protein